MVNPTKSPAKVDNPAKRKWKLIESLRRQRDESGRASITFDEVAFLVRAALARTFPDTAFELFINGAGWGEIIVGYTGGPAERLVELVVEPFAFDECHGENWLLPDGRMARAWRADNYGDGDQTDCPVPGASIVVGGPGEVTVKRREGAA